MGHSAQEAQRLIIEYYLILSGNNEEQNQDLHKTYRIFNEVYG